MTLTIYFDIIKKLYGATKTPHTDENQYRGVLLSWKMRQPKTNRSVLLKNLVKTFWRENGKKFYFMRPSNKNYT
nr:MAG TPA: hypothetical protein [Caudoviricetes sp.]